MSSSFRNAARFGAVAGLPAVLALAWPGVGSAQQTYFIPSAEVSAEYHTNRELTPDPALEDEMTGYIATVEATMGRRTQRSDTEFRPRLRFQEYPDRSGVDPVEAFLDLRSDYRTLRSVWSVLAQYSRRDTFNAEYGEAAFDDFDPENPDIGETGVVFVGDTRTRYEIRPSVERELSELMRIGAGLQYEAVDSDTQRFGAQVDYTNAGANLFVVRKMGPRAELGIGPYFSKYETDDDSNTTDVYGLSVDWTHQWSEISSVTVTALVERDEVTERDTLTGVETDESATSWGLAFDGFRRTPTGALRYRLGRFLTPSTLGSRTESDELRIQYDHALSPRLNLRSAGRFGRDRGIGQRAEDRDRDLARAEVSLEWMMTRQMYVSGGYRYAWQDRETTPGDADNNTVFVAFGFRGLDPRRMTERVPQ